MKPTIFSVAGARATVETPGWKHLGSVDECGSEIHWNEITGATMLLDGEGGQFTEIDPNTKETASGESLEEAHETIRMLAGKLRDKEEIIRKLIA